MIIDQIQRAGLYKALHPLYAAAFEYLETTDFSKLEDGKYPIKGEALFAIVATNEGHAAVAARLEIHQRYIDLQYFISGEGLIGWKPKEFCHSPAGSFDAAKDIQFFTDSVETWLRLTPGMFAVFHPYDAHAPGVGAGTIRKAIVKIAAE